MSVSCVYFCQSDGRIYKESFYVQDIPLLEKRQLQNNVNYTLYSVVQIKVCSLNYLKKKENIIFFFFT